MCGDCFVCIYLVRQCDGLELSRRNRRITVRGVAVRINNHIPCPQDSAMIPERTINHHFTYQVAQASQAKHGSLVDRGANGVLAGSDVRILSRSSRKCNVTGFDSHELQGLDVVQCAAFVETNHGIVNLIMNEYACYGRDTPSIPLDRLSGSKTQLMIGLSKLVENKGSAPLMAMPCH